MSYCFCCHSDFLRQFSPTFLRSTQLVVLHSFLCAKQAKEARPKLLENVLDRRNNAVGSSVGDRGKIRKQQMLQSTFRASALNVSGMGTTWAVVKSIKLSSETQLKNGQVFHIVLPGGGVMWSGWSILILML